MYPYADTTFAEIWRDSKKHEKNKICSDLELSRHFLSRVANTRTTPKKIVRLGFSLYFKLPEAILFPKVTKSQREHPSPALIVNQHTIEQSA